MPDICAAECAEYSGTIFKGMMVAGHMRRKEAHSGIESSCSRERAPGESASSMVAASTGELPRQPHRGGDSASIDNIFGDVIVSDSWHNQCWFW